MKKNTHPAYYNDASVTCACGNSFTTGSTIKEIRVEVCAACHPFYTGKMKYVDTVGRVEKFQKRQAHAKAKQDILLKKKQKKLAEKRERDTAPKTLREMLLGR